MPARPSPNRPTTALRAAVGRAAANAVPSSQAVAASANANANANANTNAAHPSSHPCAAPLTIQCGLRPFRRKRKPHDHKQTRRGSPGPVRHPCARGGDVRRQHAAVPGRARV
ncbi:MAG: hypothetical protein EBS11_06575 [Janthinobacterium sp.]|nr:hypothetical protein [Janthinobacterium sp.]